MITRIMIFCVAVSCICFMGCSSEDSKPARSDLLHQAAFSYTNAEALLSEIEIRKDDRLYYKKGATTPFSGVAIEMALEGYRLKESNFQNGKLHGLIISWDHEGHLFGLAVYENGQLKYRHEYGSGASETHRYPHPDEGSGQQTY